MRGVDVYLLAEVIKTGYPGVRLSVLRGKAVEVWRDKAATEEAGATVDVAILWLEAPLPEGRTIRAATFASAHSPPKPGSKMALAGWCDFLLRCYPHAQKNTTITVLRGYTSDPHYEGAERANQLQKIQLTVLQNDRCGQMLPGQPPTPFTLCSINSGPTGDIGPCLGDSGGRLNGIQSGVRRPCGHHQRPNHHTRISAIAPWIERVTGLQESE